MKKISALLLAVVMAFGMAGCSDSGSSDSDNESSAAAVQCGCADGKQCC